VEPFLHQFFFIYTIPVTNMYMSMYLIKIHCTLYSKLVYKVC